jgi:hypothetical protein
MSMLEEAIFPKSTEVVLALGHDFERLGFVKCERCECSTISGGLRRI